MHPRGGGYDEIQPISLTSLKFVIDWKWTTVAPDLVTVGFEGKEIHRDRLVTKFDTRYKIIFWERIFRWAWQWKATYYMYLAIGGQISYTPSVECIVGWTTYKMLPFCSGSTCSRRKDTRLSLHIHICVPEQGSLGMRLLFWDFKLQLK